jgi:tetratricopeptide (TPR) repeat protein
MRKDNIMFVVLGLVVGLAVGFTVANSINKSALEKQPASTASGGESDSNPSLPPGHPPLSSANSNSAQSGARPEVMAAIDKAKAQPQSYDAQMTAADLYYQIERFEDAAKFYEAAAKLKPTDAEPMVKAGNAYFDAEKYDQAEKWYLQALEKDPKNIDVRTDLGLTFFLRTPRDVERAIKEYKASLSVDPEHEITLQNLALAYDEKNDRENFLATIEKLKKVNPNNPVVTRTANK